MRKILNNNFYLVILLIVGSLRFINLGGFELQEWDESLYAVRAKSIIYFNDWTDQTPHSIEGLYSSTHPPLYIWLTGISYVIFGINEFSSRLISALAGFGTVFLVYFIGKKVFSKDIGLLSGLLLGLNPFFCFWTRQGQLDVLLLFFICLSSFFYLKSNNYQQDDKKKNIFYILCGIAAGLGLMTKLFVASFVILTILFYEILSSNKFNFRGVILMIIFSVLTALPWHLFMQIKYGNGDPFFFFNQAEIVKRTFEGIEGNTKQLGIIYYLNQIIIFSPYLFAFSVYGFYKAFPNKTIDRLFILWFILYLLIITIVSTKLAVYILPLLIPCTLFSAKILFEIFNNNLKNKTTFILLTITNLFIIWSIDIVFRIKLKEMFGHNFLGSIKTIFSQYYWLLLIFLIIEILIFVYYQKDQLNIFSKYLIGSFICLLLIFNILNFSFYDKQKYNTGIRELVKFINKETPQRIVSIGNGVNPEMTFYFDGIDIGWKNTPNFIRLEPKIGKDLIKDSIRSMEQPGTYIVIEKEEINLGSFTDQDEIIPENCKMIFESAGYSLFSFK
jgi:uncharacterized membrane protein